MKVGTNFIALRHNTLRDSSSDNGGVLSGVLAEE